MKRIIAAYKTGEKPMTERIGVYVCHCGTNIAGVVDVVEVSKWAG
jgi:hypothetical protein